MTGESSVDPVCWKRHSQRQRHSQVQIQHAIVRAPSPKSRAEVQVTSIRSESPRRPREDQQHPATGNAPVVGRIYCVRCNRSLHRLDSRRHTPGNPRPQQRKRLRTRWHTAHQNRHFWRNASAYVQAACSAHTCCAILLSTVAKHVWKLVRA